MGSLSMLTGDTSPRSLSRSHIDVGDRHETEVINIKNCHSGLGKHFFNVNRYVIFIDLGIELRTAGNFILTE